jgi:hypothetical protein
LANASLETVHHPDSATPAAAMPCVELNTNASSPAGFLSAGNGNFFVRDLDLDLLRPVNNPNKPNKLLCKTHHMTLFLKTIYATSPRHLPALQGLINDARTKTA